MKTTNEHRPDESTKELFRQLFEVQCRLELYVDSDDFYAQMTIVVIDVLLERMLNDVS